MGIVVVALSLAAALCFAAASVLQHQAASAEPTGGMAGVRLLAHLLGRPRWLAGIVADGGGYLLQVLALDSGPLALVQPLLAGGLLFALIFNRSRQGRGMRAPDWLAAAAIAGGLAIFVAVGAPRGSSRGLHAEGWAAFAMITALAVAVTVTLAQRRGPAGRAALLAAGAGIAYGLSAALTKQTLGELHLGVGHAALTAYPYLLVVAGVGGMLLTQTAFQAGPLAASLPTLTLSEPVFATVAGVLLFSEHLRGGAAGALALAGAAGAAAAVVGLTRSPSAQPLPDPVPGA